MSGAVGAIKNTVSISLFNRGNAGKVFKDVKANGAKVVIKNNEPECVLVSPEEYMEMVEEINEARLEAQALERMQNFKKEDLIPGEQVFRECGLSEDDLAGWEEVEFA